MADKKILLYGDIHLSNKDYGMHNNYEKESLWCFQQILDVAREHDVDYAIGCGDMTYSKFTKLEYRLEVEKILDELNKITDYNSYMVKGNHDSATNGMTEYEFYVDNGKLKPSQHLKVGNLNINMVDYGKIDSTDVVIEEGCKNMVVCHDYVKFKDTILPPFGNVLTVDDFSRWYGMDFIVAGHIHKILIMEGSIGSESRTHKAFIHYLGCMPRPSYREGDMDEEGQCALITVRDNGTVRYDIVKIPLWSMEESFNIERIEKKKEDKADKEEHVNISDIVRKLNEHDCGIGNPEDRINALNVPDKYKKKAIVLLQEA